MNLPLHRHTGWICKWRMWLAASQIHLTCCDWGWKWTCTGRSALRLQRNNTHSWGEAVHHCRGCSVTGTNQQSCVLYHSKEGQTQRKPIMQRLLCDKYQQLAWSHWAPPPVALIRSCSLILLLPDLGAAGFQLLSSSRLNPPTPAWPPDS